MALPTRLPSPRALPANRIPALRWGIFGPGWIAERFTQSLLQHTHQKIVAVGSRTRHHAQAFADNFGIPRAHGGGIGALVNDPNIDAVYIATPHNHHFPAALAAINAGKHVLVEKPLALNAQEVQALTEAAFARGVVCMEAFWSDFLPKFDVLRQVLADGLLGEVHTILADNGESFTPDHRIMNPALAGGPLLDLGTYPVAFATKILGAPTQVLAMGEPAPGGVNGQASILLRHAGHAQSVIHTTLFSQTTNSALIAGSEATLTLPDCFYAPGPFTLIHRDRQQRLVWEEESNRYQQLYHEAEHFAWCIGEGLRESPVRPLSDSLLTMQTIDEVRRQLGIVFEEEKA
ncbi:Gfo/Idh/MocA family protein [Nissabacter sp. SGAir0207]|uniref:Gfo/Idh/MocA family protein n=1 Tax=Nissabacter sp. SGAir0207 TaxID=2126321 RepID=UPI0010CCE7DB|nr:Gfo/Idh/MocA family oxidoreductase [Nissabacter sp. SGAir0207]QCR36071.1 oxidoreductase [Nissabacter sp. SGAir0207]